MGKSRASRAVLAILVVAAIWVIFSTNKNQNLGDKYKNKAQVPAVQRDVTSESSSSSSSEAKPVTDSQAGPSAAIPPSSEENFSAWLSEESKHLDHLVADIPEKTLQLKKMAAQLTQNQMQLLLRTSLNVSAAASERILSTFLLVEGGHHTVATLTKLATAPLSNPGPHETHSTEETLGMQDKSLRIMAIDGLVEQAKENPQARELLAKHIADIKDPYLRAYAERRLAELN